MLKGEQEFIDRPYPNEHDTPLSYLGFQQALLTGQYIRDALLSKLEKPHVHLYSSPFTRCLQTSAGVLNGIKDHISKNSAVFKNGIEVREQLSEVGTAGKQSKFTTIEDLHLN
jgi:broad specificity phosphatase PhoE